MTDDRPPEAGKARDWIDLGSGAECRLTEAAPQPDEPASETASGLQEAALPDESPVRGGVRERSRVVTRRIGAGIAASASFARSGWAASALFARSSLAALRDRLAAARDHPGLARATAALRRIRLPPWLRVAGGRLNWAWRPRLVLAGAALVLPLLVLGYLAYCLATLPLGGGLVVEPSPSALLVEAANGQVFATRGVFKGNRVSVAELPPDLPRAVVAIEDRRFYEHSGLDLRGLLRALTRNVAAGGTREGGSTITQQLVRMMYLSQDRTLKRKVQEAMLALWLEHQISKDEILSRYLNTAYFGAGVYGVDAAARRYFGKAAAELSLGEAAMMAGLVRAPSALAPHRNLDGARERADLVLDAMVETGAITRDQADAARRQPAKLRVPPDTPPGTNYFVDLVNADARRLVGSGPNDLTLRSTLDLNLQSIAESIVTRHLEKEGAAKNVRQAALVALAPDGAILAMVGGRDYDESQFNRVTQAKRQPGSLFKLFVYLAGLRAGLSPQSMVVDRPVRIGNWEPENYGGRYRGSVTVRTAFAHSINTVAAQIADKVGIDAVIDTARKLGVQSDLPRVPSLALGSAEVTLLEMVRAFAAVAVDAETLEPYALRSIAARDQTLYTRPQTPLQPASDPEVRAEMLDLLAAVVREGTGKNARVPGPAAGKTGTTQDNRDAWFIGFTPDLIVGVWVGNDDNSPTNNVTGGDLPATIWREFVTQASRGRGKPAGPMAAAKPSLVAEAPAASGPLSVAPNSSGRATILRGVPKVVDTATLRIQGQDVRLFGVEGAGGAAAREFARYIRGRETVCEPVGEEAAHRCRINGQDLSEVILFNGGGRTTAEATPELVAAEEQARAAQAGVWGR